MTQPLYKTLNEKWKAKVVKRQRKETGNKFDRMKGWEYRLHKRTKHERRRNRGKTAVPFGMTLTPERLKELRALPYDEYLKTEEWRIRRKWKLRQADYRCQKCRRSDVGLDVHHTTYQNRGNEAETDLKVLCRGCHTKEHIKKGDIEA